jgi:xanthine dehydrogenase YagR molybdenum-binding subunit
MNRQTTTKRDPQQAEAPPSNAVADAEHNVAPNDPGRSRQQAMLCGIVGERLEHITHCVPPDEPLPLPENAELSAIGKSIPRFDAVQMPRHGRRDRP